VSADSSRLLCISLHDVAPATLDECANTLAFLDDLRLGPVALLVVPDYHGLGRADRDHRFASFIESRILRGDEIVLHGYRHADTAPRPRGVREWLTRRIYTDGEGEFSQLDFEAARTRILRGLVVLRSAGWYPTGFVAPAWLMSRSALCALEETPLQYCAARDTVIVLKSGHTVPAPSLVVSTRAAWRRAVSPMWNQALLERHSTSRVVRAALHPADLRYPAIEQLWRTLLSQLSDRRVVTECHLVPHPPMRDAHRESGGQTFAHATKQA
jgi:predicted deacetylase